MTDFSLKLYQQFKQILDNYKVSNRAKKALEGLNLVLMVAPTSSGRNTIIKKLLETGDYYFIVSDTTRPAQLRDGKMEETGAQYFFRSEEEILADLQAGEFLEAALIHQQQVSGVSIRELEKAKTGGKIAITDIEIVGADNVMQVKPDAKAIFVLPPSFEEWQRRINGRSQMSPQEISNRLASAQKELKAALDHDYYQFVIADDISRAVSVINSIASGEKALQEQQKGRQLAQQFYDQLQQKLASS